MVLVAVLALNGRMTRSGEKGGGDSIKQFSIQLSLDIFFHHTHIMERGVCRGLYTELFHAIIPTLFPYYLSFCTPTS